MEGYQLTSEGQRFLRWLADASPAERTGRPYQLKERAGIALDEPGYLGLLVALARAGLVWLPIGSIAGPHHITPRGREAVGL